MRKMKAQSPNSKFATLEAVLFRKRLRGSIRRFRSHLALNLRLAICRSNRNFHLGCNPRCENIEGSSIVRPLTKMDTPLFQLYSI